MTQTIKQHLEAIREAISKSSAHEIKGAEDAICAIEVILDAPMKSAEEWVDAIEFASFDDCTERLEERKKDKPHYRVIETIRAIQQDAIKSYSPQAYSKHIQYECFNTCIDVIEKYRKSGRINDPSMFLEIEKLKE